MVIEKKHIDTLKPADYNPRKDLKPGDAEYKVAITRQRWLQPLLF